MEEASAHLNGEVCIPADFNESNTSDHHPIIVIPGFWGQDLVDRPTCDELLARYKNDEHAEYGDRAVLEPKVDRVPNFWDAQSAARIDWSSKDRLDTVIQKNVLPVMKKLSDEDICEPNGCVLVTHSTGDLIASKWLDEGPGLLKAEGMKNVKIVASFDFAGAAGGSEMADMTLDAVSVKDFGAALLGFLPSFSETDLQKIATWFFSEALFETDEIIRVEDTGILQDLSINAARNNIFHDRNRVPRLRIATEAPERTIYFWISKSLQVRTLVNTFMAFIFSPGDWWKIGPGSNDGAVSSHSSCGAAGIGGFTRCSPNLGFDGNREKIRWVAPRRLKASHYPLLVSDQYHHLEIWADQYRGRFWRSGGKPARAIKRLTEFNQSGVDAVSEQISPAAKVYQIIQSAGSE